ncbi:MAG: hypothetical protein P4K98_07935 [Bryobacteraceae bacterium]|nr:hypothetical protein [Bryobacteraceae bacterium]
MERRLSRQPMGEGREALRRGLGNFREYLDKRRTYSDAVLAYLDKRRAEPGPGHPAVTSAEVYRDHIYELGMHLAALRERLSALREFPEWTQVRRSIQQESDLAFKLQSSRRAEMPVELSLGELRPPAAVTPLSYRNLDQGLMVQLDRLWTRYYQALDDALEQKPGGAPLTPAGSADSAAPVAGVPGGAPAAQSSGSALPGIWTYLERSQRFNGVGEPGNVLLELWIENGLLVGRYRAELPDFQGKKVVDLRLHGHIAPAGAPQILDFESKIPAGSGQIVIEGPSGGGMEVMLERRVPSFSAIPRGREMLRRH